MSSKTTTERGISIRGVMTRQRALPATAPTAAALRADLLSRYQGTRRFSEMLCDTLEPEDCVIQTMPEASPTKWHLAHTSWFFETFVVKPRLLEYQPLHPQYAFLFNSYYNAAGKMHARPLRGLISRPTLKETFAYRQYVDSAVRRILSAATEDELRVLAPLIILGVNHEQQHQELMLTDIKHVFWMNPLRPVYRTETALEESWGIAPGAAEDSGETGAPSWRRFQEGIYPVGHEGPGFSFDNEGPRHRRLLKSFEIGARLVTNREYLGFIEDEGYKRPDLWLSLGWTLVNERGWEAPLYWERLDGEWWAMTLGGMKPLRLDEPVCHVSYYEADAFARWAGAKLPEEAEWETAAGASRLEGSFLEASRFHPACNPQSAPGDLCEMFGEVWQWTQSAYAPYPGYKSAAGALGEYNGKFMCNQYVLRGASCVTPRSHARRTYRNFFPPDARWQFSGIRLARDAQ